MLTAHLAVVHVDESALAIEKANYYPQITTYRLFKTLSIALPKTNYSYQHRVNYLINAKKRATR